MFEYAQAMQLANQVLRSNPNTYEYDIEWTKDGKKHSVPANLLGSGSTSIVFLGKDKHVYIGSRTDSQDRAKEILAMFYEQYGSVPYIPQIEYIETTEFPFPIYDTSPSNVYTVEEDEDAAGELKNKEPIGYEQRPVQMYRSKLYKVPVNNSGLEYARVIESFYRRTNFDVGRKVGDFFDELIEQENYSYDNIDKINNFVDAFRAQELAKALSDKRSFKPFMHNLSEPRKKTMLSIFESFVKLQRFVYENVDTDTQTVSFEFQDFNLGNDSRKRLILLDIFFTRNKPY